MDKKEFDEHTSRLLEIAKVLEKLPTEVRVSAFDLIKGYVTGHPSGSGGGRGAAAASKQATVPKSAPVDGEDDATFFGRFDHDKPADNVKLVVADHFRKYGSAPFTVEEIQQRASDVGITIPDRPDMTIRQARVKGNKLFSQPARGQFKPTVHGETYLKTTYNVKKGTTAKPAAAK